MQFHIILGAIVLMVAIIWGILSWVPGLLGMDIPSFLVASGAMIVMVIGIGHCWSVKNAHWKERNSYDDGGKKSQRPPAHRMTDEAPPHIRKNLYELARYNNEEDSK